MTNDKCVFYYEPVMASYDSSVINNNIFQACIIVLTIDSPFVIVIRRQITELHYTFNNNKLWLFIQRNQWLIIDFSLRQSCLVDCIVKKIGVCTYVRALEVILLWCNKTKTKLVINQILWLTLNYLVKLHTQ
jgi:hypothetical protein